MFHALFKLLLTAMNEMLHSKRHHISWFGFKHFDQEIVHQFTELRCLAKIALVLNAQRNLE